MISVREIIDPPVPTPVPLTPPFIHGLFNLRGEVVTLLDLAPFVGAKPQPEAVATRAVVLQHGPIRFAVPTPQIQTLLPEAPPTELHPQAAMYPALEVELPTDRGQVHVLNLDRLAATVGQSMRFGDLASNDSKNP